MKKAILLFSLCLLTIPPLTAQAPSDDYKAIHAIILDYVEGLYDGDSSRVAYSLHPELRKRGYRYNKSESRFIDNEDMTRQQLMDLAERRRKSGRPILPPAPKIIEIYDISSRTASAKLTASWGLDYFHLAKLDGRWYIMNVLWQSVVESD